jgi:hypothetical protein
MGTVLLSAHFADKRTVPMSSRVLLVVTGTIDLHSQIHMLDSADIA